MRWNIKMSPAYHRNGKNTETENGSGGNRTSKQEEWLRQHGVHYGQGWLTARHYRKRISYAGPSNICEFRADGTPHSPSRYLLVDD